MKTISFVLGAAFALSATAHAEVRTDSYLALKDGKSYQLVAKHSGKCLDVRDHSTADGGALQQWSCSGKANQKFRAKDAYKNAWTFYGQASQLCVKVENESLDDGAGIVQSNYCPGNSPRAYLHPNGDGSVSVRFTHSGKCLDVASADANNGARTQQWSCHGGPNQQWYLVEQSDKGGEKSWELKGHGVQTDNHGRVFRTQTYPESSFALLNKNTGKDIWSIKSQAIFSQGVNCNDHDKVFVNDGSKVRALNPHDGKTLWTTDVGDTSNALYCVAGYNSLFLSSGEGRFRSLEKATGKIRWTYSGKNLGYVGKDSDTIYLNSYDNGKSSLVAIASGSGHKRWSKDMKDGQWHFVDAKNRLYLTNSGKSYSRINRDNGSDLWTYWGNGSSEWIGLDFHSEGSAIYARQGRDFKRLNPDNGHVQWSYTLPVSIRGTIATAMVLKSGDILITTDSSNRTATGFIYLKADGSGSWQADHGGAYATATEDKQGNLFVRSGKSVSLIDRATGASKWNFVRDHAVENESIYGLESYGDSTYVTYGHIGGRFPPMGIVRLDTKTGAAQWDIWVNETVSFIAGDQDYLITSGPMASRVVSYKR